MKFGLINILIAILALAGCNGKKNNEGRLIYHTNIFQSAQSATNNWYSINTNTDSNIICPYITTIESNDCCFTYYISGICECLQSKIIESPHQKNDKCEYLKSRIFYSYIKLNDDELCIYYECAVDTTVERNINYSMDAEPDISTQWVIQTKDLLRGFEGVNFYSIYDNNVEILKVLIRSETPTDLFNRIYLSLQLS